MPDLEPPQSREEDMLYGLLGDTSIDIPDPRSRIEKLLIALIEAGGGGGGGGTAGVISFNNRAGVVMPQAGDYRANQVMAADGRSVQAFIDAMAVSTSVDSALSATSTNPVQNRAIYRALQDALRNSLPAGGGAGDVLTKVDATDGNAAWRSTDDLMRRSVYDPDLDGKVEQAESADAVRGPLYSATLPNKGADTTLLTDADKGVANGVVPLDGNRKILPEYIPDNIMAGLTYGGVFNANTRVVELTPAAQSILDVSTPTITLEDSATIPTGYPANAPLFYVTSTAGTFAGMDFAPGDWLMSISTSWQQIISGAQVSSVNGETGAVVLDSDDVAQGTVNLYMRTTERAKLADIENRATRDVNVLQSAEMMTDADDKDFLRLTNKNGDVTDFYGGAVDLTEYLKVDGDASDTTAVYSTVDAKADFTGSETESGWRARVVAWLHALKGVAFSADYDDVTYNKPTYNGVTVEGDKVAADYGTLDVQVVTALPTTPVLNTLYVHETTVDGEPANRFYVSTEDGLQEIKTNSFKVYEFATSPETTPPTYNGIYVYEWTPAGSTTQRHMLGIMWNGNFRELALRYDILTNYDDLTGKPEIDGNELRSGNQTHESLGLVGMADFVTTPTGKTSGIEFVVGEGTPSAPAVITEINDSAEMRYSTVHTSSNHYLNAQIDAINDALAAKLNMLIVEELPDPVTRNTMYYVETATAGVYDIVMVDSVGTQQTMGSTVIDLGGLVSDTRRVAGIALDADISAAQVATAIQGEAATLANKAIDADDNSITNLTTSSIKSTSIATDVSATPSNAKLTTEKCVADYAVKRSGEANRIYGTNGSGAEASYALSTSVNGLSTDSQVPTAKGVYGFAVAKTANPSRVYGTGSSGEALEYVATGTYTSSADGQLLTRAGAYNMYTTLKSCANNESVDVPITMTALENDFVYARKQWARRIANNVYAICFEMYRNAASEAGVEVRVNMGRSFKVNGSDVAAGALSAVSVYDSSAIGCTYNGGSFFFNPTNAVGSGDSYLFRVTGIVYTA